MGGQCVGQEDCELNEKEKYIYNFSADEKKGVVLAIWRDLVGVSESLLDEAILAGNFD